jgi:hypothetical protein
MSQLPPDLKPRSGPPDDLDRLLGRYFKAQVPHPFPPLRLPEPAQPAARAVASGDSGYRARVSLAVSAALLLGGGWYLSGQFAPAPLQHPQPGIGDKATANEKGPLQVIREEKSKKAADPAEGFVPGPINLP